MSTAKYKLIFVTGIFRSGTTLVSRLLSANPEIGILYQPLFPFFRMWRNLFLENVGQGFNKLEPMGSNILMEDLVWEQWKRKSVEVIFSQNDTARLSHDLAEELLRDKNEKPEWLSDIFCSIPTGSAGEILLKMIDRMKSRYGNERILFGIKEIWCEEFAVPLMGLPDLDVFIIHVFRDPRAVLASRNTGHYCNENGGLNYPLKFIAESWNRSSCIADRLSVDKQRFYSLCYENLVLNPEREIGRICKFLGKNIHRDMLDPSRYLDGRQRPWLPNTTGSVRNRSFNHAPLEYWRSVLSDKIIGTMEYFCRDRMLQGGYKPKYTKKQSRLYAERYVENMEDIQDWLCNSRYVMAKSNNGI